MTKARHIVMFNLKEDLTDHQELEGVRVGLLALRYQYPTFLSMNLPAGQAHPVRKNRSSSWMAEFASLQEYQE
jgi:hypothetical protein